MINGSLYTRGPIRGVQEVAPYKAQKRTRSGWNGFWKSKGKLSLGELFWR